MQSQMLSPCPELSNQCLSQDYTPTIIIIIMTANDINTYNITAQYSSRVIQLL